MGSDGFRWVQIGSDEFIWVQMGSDGFRWIQMGSDELRWIQMDSDRLSIRGVKDFQQGFCSPSVIWVVSAPHWKFIVTIIAIVLIIVIISKCFHLYYCTALAVSPTPKKCLSGPSAKSTAGWQNHDTQCQLGHLGAGVVRVGHGRPLRDEGAGPALFLVLACHHQHHLTILVNVHNVHCTWAYLRLSPSLANLVLFHSIITIIIVIKDAP